MFLYCKNTVIINNNFTNENIEIQGKDINYSRLLTDLALTAHLFNRLELGFSCVLSRIVNGSV